MISIGTDNYGGSFFGDGLICEGERYENDITKFIFDHRYHPLDCSKFAQNCSRISFMLLLSNLAHAIYGVRNR